jgi:hypothetical protein
MDTIISDCMVDGIPLVFSYPGSDANVEVQYRDAPGGIPGGYINIKVTHEGIIIDVVDLDTGHVIGTRAEEFVDILFDCIGDPE